MITSLTTIGKTNLNIKVQANFNENLDINCESLFLVKRTSKDYTRLPTLNYRLNHWQYDPKLFLQCIDWDLL